LGLRLVVGIHDVRPVAFHGLPRRWPLFAHVDCSIVRRDWLALGRKQRSWSRRRALQRDPGGLDLRAFRPDRRARLRTVADHAVDLLSDAQLVQLVKAADSMKPK
jgi:hypothetical protein